MSSILVLLGLIFFSLLILASTLALLFGAVKKIKDYRQILKHAKNLEKQISSLKQNVTHLLEFSENQMIKKAGSFKSWLKKDERTKIVSKTGIQKMLALAETALARGELDKAEPILIQILAKDQDNQVATTKLALIYLHTKQYKRAETLYSQLIEKGSKDTAIYSNLGVALYNQKKLSLAMKTFQKAIELDPYRPARFISLAQIHCEIGDPKNALLLIEKALRLDSKNMGNLLFAAATAKDASDKFKAKEYYKKALALDPYNIEIKKEIAKL